MTKKPIDKAEVARNLREGREIRKRLGIPEPVAVSAPEGWGCGRPFIPNPPKGDNDG